MKATRRNVLAGGVLGALAVPTVAGLASWRWQHGEGSTLLYDATLGAGRRFADAGRAAGANAQAIEGDAVRFAKALVEQRPALIAGVSRAADALLVGEVAQEEGYGLALELRGGAETCEAFNCDPGWNALARFAVGAGADWPEALAGWAADPSGRGEMPRRGWFADWGADREGALGWVLAQRA